MYRAEDRATGKQVALKVLNTGGARTRDRFEREVEVLSGLLHPNIVRYLDHGITDNGEPYLVMEWLEGESLSARLARSALTLEQTVELGRAVSEALAAAHKLGVVHRDIKPSNLFLAHGEPRDVRVLDFGIAHIFTTSQIVSHTSGILGTPGYMAPEQAHSEHGIVGPPADVFSLGAVLFECLTGRRAFGGAHLLAVLAEVLLAEAPRVRDLLPDVPAPLDELVARMLAKDPDKRPEDGAALVLAFDALSDEEGAPLSLRLSPVPPSLTSRERRFMALIAVSHGGRGKAPGETYRRIARELGGATFDLAGGTTLMTFAGAGEATEHATAAARSALRLRKELPDVAVVVAMGYSEQRGKLPVGPVVEHAAELLASISADASGEIVVDDVAHALLDERFELRPRDSHLVLVRERALGASARKVLGRSSPYVGRDRELRMMTELVLATFEGERPAQVAIVTAPPGAGKTRLRHELLKNLRAECPNLAVGIGRADAMTSGVSYGALGAAIRYAARIASDEPEERAEARLAEHVASYVPASDARRVTLFLGQLAGLPFASEDADDLRAARDDGALMAEEIGRAFVEYVRGVCAVRPTILLLEDLHWGDSASMRLVDHALFELADSPFVVVALGRPELLAQYPDLWANREVHAIRLAPLGRRAATFLVRELLGKDAKDEDVSRIVELAGGNAFYLEELVRAAREGRGEHLPDTVLGMVEARILALPSEARRLLRAGSIFGVTFSKRGALALLHEEERALAEKRWLPWLIEHELLVERAGSEKAQMAFRHTLVREGAYAMLLDSDRILGHRLAAEWLAAEGAASDAPGVLGEHYFRAKQWSLAATALETAGDRAARLQSTEDAKRYYERAKSALKELGGTAPDRERIEESLAKLGPQTKDGD